MYELASACCLVHMFHTIALSFCFILLFSWRDQVVYLGIEDIYEMRVSFSSLRKYVDTYGSISSNRLPLAGSVTGDLVSLWFP